MTQKHLPTYLTCRAYPFWEAVDSAFPEIYDLNFLIYDTRKLQHNLKSFALENVPTLYQQYVYIKNIIKQKEV